jgi:hypothetical protein|tara:strand:- start:136 stop:345 length:210 start_codon:yes stop_codon:yes gene_type:complete
MPYTKNSAGGTMMNYNSLTKTAESLLKTQLWRKTMNDKAEVLNGRAAMIGFIAAVGAYLTTGQIIPGIW